MEDYETGDESIHGRWIGLKPTYEYIKKYMKERLMS